VRDRERRVPTVPETQTSLPAFAPLRLQRRPAGTSPMIVTVSESGRAWYRRRRARR
jgi:hypothetical protein